MCFSPALFSYVGDRETSNMALVVVEMLSGFIPAKSSVKAVRLLPLAFPEDMKICFSDVAGPEISKHLRTAGEWYLLILLQIN